MQPRDWDKYYCSHYKPIGAVWGKRDLKKYRRWYSPWITYLESKHGFSFSDTSAVELGCGIGAFSSLLFEHGCRIMGTDIASSMVEAAGRVCPQIPFFQYNMLTSFPKKKLFDYVFAFEVLEHISNPKLGIGNIRKILKRDGWFIGSTPYPYKKNMVDPTHIHVHLPVYWNELFNQAGFKYVQTVPMSFLPFLWRIHPILHPVLSRYISFPFFVSTTLILARKNTYEP
jgi:SAM-dependent methyltransferase